MSQNLTNATEQEIQALETLTDEKLKSNVYKGSMSENNIKQTQNVKVSRKLDQNSESKVADQLDALALVETAKMSVKREDKCTPTSYKSLPLLNESKTGCLTTNWESYNLKKNRKDFKRKNNSNSGIKGINMNIPVEGVLNKDNLEEPSEETLLDDESFQYKYFPKNSKSVVFTKDVLVIYFNGEDVVSELKEPLKKEVEQQVRNKEMRQTHLIKTQEKYNLCLF
ncbi:uncharacterized protein LOC109607868 [Aethina tumida]|uniref:uncharacterized protein LOC109607868 n=1 Tax=Aethina tumida TaxID=116153 RepID=UPI00096B37A4|nr:uncharacterized protein LOC109607868 [Aethina tumida]